MNPCPDPASSPPVHNGDTYTFSVDRTDTITNAQTWIAYQLHRR